MKILAVDDDFINLKLIQSMFKSHPKVDNLITASNGLEALNFLKNNSDIVLVLLDIKMPIMDGMEFLDNIKADEELKKVPVIVLTTDEDAKSKAINKGANDFLPKPIRREALMQKVDNLLPWP